MKRRFNGKASSTPRSATTIIHAMMCSAGMTVFVTSMYAASAEMSGDTM